MQVSLFDPIGQHWGCHRHTPCARDACSDAQLFDLAFMRHHARRHTQCRSRRARAYARPPRKASSTAERRASTCGDRPAQQPILDATAPRPAHRYVPRVHVCAHTCRPGNRQAPTTLVVPAHAHRRAAAHDDGRPICRSLHAARLRPCGRPLPSAPFFFLLLPLWLPPHVTPAASQPHRILPSASRV